MPRKIVNAVWAIFHISGHHLFYSLQKNLPDFLLILICHWLFGNMIVSFWNLHFLRELFSHLIIGFQDHVEILLMSGLL